MQRAARTPSLRVLSDGLEVEAPLHGLARARFPFIWLRDSCPGPISVDPSTRQRLFRTSDVPPGISATRAEWQKDGDKWRLLVDWDRPLRGVDGPAGQSAFDLDYLARHASLDHWRAWTKQFDLAPRIWDRSSYDAARPRYRHADLCDDSVRLTALRELITTGLVTFTDVSVTDKSDTNCELIRLAQQLGEIRRTWYGDRVWDVKSVAGSKNIAYTNLDLGLHMDLVHFETPPRFQLLHYLHSHPARSPMRSLLTAEQDLRGGESYFVDSFAVAERIRAQSPAAFDTLVREPVAFEYRNGGHWRHWERPTIELDDAGRVRTVNYSPPFQGPLLQRGDALVQLRDALQLFADATEDPALRYTVQLKPGECAAFDNRRVLHARTAFDLAPGAVPIPDQPIRWLKGVYVEGDSVQDSYRVLASGPSV